MLPLGRFPLVRTRSIDEAGAMYRSLHIPITIEPLGPASAFGWVANHVAIDRVALLVSQHAGASRCSAESGGTAFCFQIARAGRARLWQAGAASSIEVGARAVMVSPDLPVRFEAEPGFEGMQVMISERVLGGALDAIVGSPRRGPLRFEPGVDLTSGGGVCVSQLIAVLMDGVDREHGVLRAPLVASGLVDALLHALVLGLPHNRSAAVRACVEPAEPAYLRRAEEWLEANLDRSITSEELALRVGTSVRGIQAAFRRYRGSTPTTFVRERRLALARRRLLAGTSATVADVAFACGFAHLGRFSGAYVARFGEHPSETLASAGVRDPDSAPSLRG